MNKASRSSPAARQQNGNRRHTGDDEHGHSWRDADHVTYVWDLSQTSGQPLPVRAATRSPPGEVPPGLWEALCWLARREGFAVEREPGCPDDGTTLWAARRIRVLPGPHRQPGDLGAGPPARTRAPARHDRPRARYHHNRLPGRAESRSRLRRIHHLRPARRPRRARLRQPADLGRQRSAGPARRRHPGRRRAHHHGRGENQPPPGPPPARQHRRPGSTCPSRNDHADRSSPLRPPRPPNVTPGSRTSCWTPNSSTLGQLAGSWVPAYLRKRGITAAAMGEWHIGYAPRGWTALTSYLRGRGHHDDAIQAAGLARVSSRGTLIDHFRDRVMLPVHDERGNPGRVHRPRPPRAGPAVPKYLNGPATSRLSER